MKHSTIADLILNNAFELYGQPKWTFGKNTCNTYEVFAEKIRLQDGQFINAKPFLELIEGDESLTLLFSNWFIKAAAASAAAINEKTQSNVTLSIDLLPLYAAQATFVPEILKILATHGLKPEKLRFELSEAQNLSSKGVENLNLLHDEYGVRLYLANFGKGYSNIDLLTEVHFDGIELDRSYAAHVPQHEQSCRLVVAIQHLAHTLDLLVCAKGIETQEQFEFFEELDCYKGQGFLIGEPMNLAQLEEYVYAHAVRAE